MTRLRSFLARPPAERRVFMRALWLLPALHAALWVTPPRTLRDRLARRGPARAKGPSAAQIGWAVRTAARYVPGATCLVQALAASALLSRAGHAPDLRIGVVKPDRSALSAHAWVERDGVIVVGAGEHDRYHALPTI